MQTFPLDDMPENFGNAVPVTIEIVKRPGSSEMRAKIIQIVESEPSEFKDGE